MDDTAYTIWSDGRVLAAFVSAIVTILIAFWTYFTTRKNNRNIESFKNQLAEKKSLNDARREYEFEARKRLYSEYEPLLFQLTETADDALHRVQSLARTSKLKKLDKNGWLSQLNYYTLSTIYKLFSPLAIFQMMRKKITLVDLRVDSNIGFQYLLAKQLYIAYTDDFEFARMGGFLEYEPNHMDWRKLRKKEPSKYWRQGLPMGLLDKTLEILIEKDGDKERLISYGEFERKIQDENSHESKQFALAQDIIYYFHPDRRPVLWRILITQACLFNALLEFRKLEEISVSKMVNFLLSTHEDEIEKYKWKDELSNDELNEPFNIAREYLKKRVNNEWLHITKFKRD